MPHFIYVHVPFCEQKCTYCDFYTITSPPDAVARTDRWLAIARRELELLSDAGDAPHDDHIQTIFLGGGTPSLATPGAVADFIRTLELSFGLAANCEVTLETQPATCPPDKVRALASAGINRYSIGIQTFNPRLLALTARRHTVADALAVADCVRSLTHAALSIDLICAWPSQTLAEWESDLHQALQLQPDHISVYELTFHAGTELARRMREGTIKPAPEELRADMFNLTSALLTDKGFEHYEISNYALRRPDGSTARSRHNENYWQLGNYLGLGAGAHSFQFPRRWLNPHNASAYELSIRAGRLFRQSVDSPDPHLAAAESLQFALRLLEGVDMDQFARRFGVDIRQVHASHWRALVDEGLLIEDGPLVRLSHAGRLRLDSIIEYLL